MMADAAEERMQNRIPMNRIARAFGMRCGFIISRQLLARYFIKYAARMRAACEYLCDRVMSERIIHLDETFLHCREEENNRQYALVFTSDRGCFFRYTDSRSPTVPLKILDNHFGNADRRADGNGNSVIICADGRHDEDWLKNPDGTHNAKVIGCMARLRRYVPDVTEAHENHIDPTSEDCACSVCEKSFIATANAKPGRTGRNEKIGNSQAKLR